MVICTDTALRLIKRHKATEDGYTAFNILRERYNAPSVGYIADVESCIQEWTVPSRKTDPQEAFLDLFEQWDILERHHVPTEEMSKVMFLIAKIRKSPDYKDLITQWAGSSILTFMRSTTTQFISEQVYEHWDMQYKPSRDSAKHSSDNSNGDATYNLRDVGDLVCSICGKLKHLAENCRNRFCAKCGKRGHSQQECRGSNTGTTHPSTTRITT